MPLVYKFTGDKEDQEVGLGGLGMVRIGIASLRKFIGNHGCY